MSEVKQYLAKYFTNLVSIITLFGMIYLAYDLYHTKEREKEERKLLEERYQKLIGQQSEFSNLTESLSQLAIVYKDQAELAKTAAEAFRDLAKEREERIKLLSRTVVSVDENISSQIGPDYIYETPEKTNGYILNELRIEGKDSPPIGYVLIKKNGETFKKNYKFEIALESVQLKDDLTGEIRVVSRAYLIPQENGLAENKRTDLKKWKGEKYPLKVTGGEVVVDPKEPLVPTDISPGLIPWSLNLSAGIGIFTSGQKADARPTLDIALAGWGISKRDLTWKFGQVGANYVSDRGIGFHLIPFSYRVFPDALTNTYVAPGWFIDGESQGYLLGLNASL